VEFFCSVSNGMDMSVERFVPTTLKYGFPVYVMFTVNVRMSKCEVLLQDTVQFFIS